MIRSDICASVADLCVIFAYLGRERGPTSLELYRTIRHDD